MAREAKQTNTATTATYDLKRTFDLFTIGLQTKGPAISTTTREKGRLIARRSLGKSPMIWCWILLAYLEQETQARNSTFIMLRNPPVTR